MTSDPSWEVNFDGLSGPTHHYGGLALGNLPSAVHHGLISSPRAAALEGLRKMKRLADLGLRQAVLPPAPRPDWELLRRCGHGEAASAAISSAARLEPRLLQQAYSAASMWAANAATVIPSADSHDGRVHLVPANLHTMLHRAGEAAHTQRVFALLFGDPHRFAVHPPLPAHGEYADEGAANHMRLGAAHDAPGWHVLVHGVLVHGMATVAHTRGEVPVGGQRGQSQGHPRRGPYPARQTLAASQRIVRLLGDPRRAILVQQNRRAIDAGVFHNDVIAMSQLDRICYHERAYRAPGRFRKWLRGVGGGRLRVRVVTERELSLDDAVASYVFNSQVVAPPEMGGPLILAPEESRENAAAERLLMGLVAEGWAERVEFIDIRQSMRNGGGPACLRLRVPLTAGELGRVRGRVMLDQTLYDELAGWVMRHYRDSLSAADLADPTLAVEVRTALDELTGIMRLGSIYPFQREHGTPD